MDVKMTKIGLILAVSAILVRNNGSTSRRIAILSGGVKRGDTKKTF